jgi:hypothetical protein
VFCGVFLEKADAERGVLMVSLWWIAWWMWSLDARFFLSAQKFWLVRPDASVSVAEFFA